MAKPIHVVSPKIERRDDGGANLTIPIKQRGVATWLFRLPEGASKTFELDQMGMLVWDNIDGKTSVQQLIRKLAKRYQVSLREAEVSTLTFLNMLTRKGLVGMQVPEKPAKKKSEAT
jgi:hypothetical protein